MSELEREAQFTDAQRVEHLEADLKVATTALRKVTRINPVVIQTNRGPNNKRGPAIVTAFANAQKVANEALDALFQAQFVREAPELENV
jgi:hypothetical protein